MAILLIFAERREWDDRTRLTVPFEYPFFIIHPLPIPPPLRGRGGWGEVEISDLRYEILDS